MKYAIVLLLVVVVGCVGPTFTDLGNGVAVPVESIDRYARKHGVTRAEARLELRKKSDDERVHEYASKYGITPEEAKRQIEHAASQQPSR